MIQDGVNFRRWCGEYLSGETQVRLACRDLRRHYPSVSCTSRGATVLVHRVRLRMAPGSATSVYGRGASNGELWWP